MVSSLTCVRLLYYGPSVQSVQKATSNNIFIDSYVVSKVDAALFKEVSNT